MDRDALERAAERAIRRRDIGEALAILEVRAQAGTDGARWRHAALDLAEEALGPADPHTRAAAERLLAADPGDPRGRLACAAAAAGGHPDDAAALRQALTHLQAVLQSDRLWSIGRGVSPGAAFLLLGDTLEALARHPDTPPEQADALRRDAARAWHEGGPVHGALVPFIRWLLTRPDPTAAAGMHADALGSALALSAAGPDDPREVAARAIARFLLRGDRRALFVDALEVVAAAVTAEDQPELRRTASDLRHLSQPQSAALLDAAAADPTWTAEGRSLCSDVRALQLRAAAAGVMGVAPAVARQAASLPGGPPRTETDRLIALLQFLDPERGAQALAGTPTGLSLAEALLSGALLDG